MEIFHKKVNFKLFMLIKRETKANKCKAQTKKGIETLFVEYLSSHTNNKRMEFETTHSVHFQS